MLCKLISNGFTNGIYMTINKQLETFPFLFSRFHVVAPSGAFGGRNSNFRSLLCNFNALNGRKMKTLKVRRRAHFVPQNLWQNKNVIDKIIIEHDTWRLNFDAQRICETA